MAVAAGNLTDLRLRLESAQAKFQAGQIGEAAKAYRDILDEIPDQPDALHMMGAIAYRMGRTELALQLYDEAVKVVPHFALAWSNRALILRVLGRSEEALESGRKATALDPNLADGWDVTGLLLRERKEHEAALNHHERARLLNPNNQHMQNNYAVALAAMGRLKDAYRAAKKALTIDPHFAYAELTIANLYGAAGWPEKAVAHYDKVLELQPDLAEALASQGRAHMLMGDMKKGWGKMEAQKKYDKQRFAFLPLWRGEKTGHLILYAEQGVGDVIQFIRYIPLVRDRFDRLTLEVPASLQKLIKAQLPDVTVITPDDPVPAADAFGLLMSIPSFCDTTLETIPATIPYIEADSDERQFWCAKLSALPSPRIGVVWMGNPAYSNDHNRSLKTDELRPLLEIAEGHFVSMQKGSTTATESRLPIFDAGPWLTDFSSTAALIAELDLVIAVDTGVAHLAGALGKPVWILLPFASDWRWMMEREDSPWYPTARLFRQKAPKTWGEVIARVRTELQGFLGGDRSVLTPKAWDGPIPRQDPNAIDLEN